MTTGPVIERLPRPASDADVRGLARLLAETVEAGGVVSFVAPLTREVAEAWWRKTLDGAHEHGIFLVARAPASNGSPDAIVGTVQVHPAWAPNQPHRAEITKLLVDRRCRRLGLGARLMAAAEAAARAAGFRLLTLDTKTGDAADRLFRRAGWTVVGTIPRFGLDPDGTTPHDATLFYKELP